MQQMIDQCAELMNGMMGNGMLSGGMMNGMMGGMMPMLLGTLLSIATVVAGVVLLVRFLGDRTSRNDRTPEIILAERFARGEIDLEEYHDRRRVVQAH